MTTATTNTFCAQDTNAHFQAWVNEVFTNLVTNCGLTQTADTGQMAVPCVTAAPGAASTSAGYYVFKFNDTLQATAPIFLKIEFGSGVSGATFPMMWITVGTGSNGSGTINGTAMTRVAMLSGQVAGQSTTNFNSYYCYNTAQGFLGLAFKVGQTTTNEALGGFVLYRTVNGSGVSTGDGCMLITNSSTANGVSASDGKTQCLNFNTSAAQTLPAADAWGTIPFSTTATLEGTAGMVFPCFQYKGNASTPGWGITNACALGINNEIGIGNTVTVTILGVTSLTYLNTGHPFNGSTYTNVAYSATTYGFLMLWQ